MYTIDRDREITTAVVCLYIQRHRAEIDRFEKMSKYYEGDHNIKNRAKGKNLANNRVVCNHAKHITDTAVGYLAGNPVTYKSKGEADISGLAEWLELADANTQDMDIAKDASIFGRGFELVYMSDDESPTPKLACFDPREAFVVYDNTVEHRPVFGVYYYPERDENGTLAGYSCCWITAEKQVNIMLSSGFTQVGEEEESGNVFGEVPLIELDNNEEQQGDFEQVLDLIDAYNILQSDRVNDKQQFVEAILLIKGSILGDDEKEESEAYQRLREYGMLFLSEESSAEWLTRTFDENSVEVLRRSLEQDIHKFSGIPCLTDENFAGNASGVAMKYKLLGFEQITKIKERYFKEALKYRIRLFCRVMEIKGKPAINPDDVEIVFKRNLPSNELELAQLVSALWGMVPEEILLSQLPFVSDPEEAANQMQAQKDAAIKRQQEAFRLTANTPPEGTNEKTQ